MALGKADYLPDAGTIGNRDKNGLAPPLKALTELQEAYMKYYFECNGNARCILESAGFRSLSNTINMGKTKRIQIEIARRSRVMGRSVMRAKAFNVSKEDRLELLWLIAEGGAERITDKEGNMIFMNPAVSVSAIRTINEMLPGSLAPKEVEITHKVDTRSEKEIRDNIAKLNAEYQSLVSIDGKTIRMKEKDIKKSETVPLVKPNGDIKGLPGVRGEPGANEKGLHIPARPKGW